MLKKGRLMSNGHYLVEVSRSERALFVAAAKMEGTENYLIELSNEKAEETLAEFGGSYDELVAHLEVLNKRLVLLNPRKGRRKRKSKKSKKKSNGPHAHGTEENEDPNAATLEMESEESTALALSEEAVQAKQTNKQAHAQSMPVLPELTERPGYAVGPQNEPRGEEEIQDLRQS